MSCLPSGRSQRVSEKPKVDVSSPRLIALVKQYPCLWDPEHPGYKDTRAKEQVWKYIGSRFWDFSGPRAKYSWEKLRTARTNFYSRLNKPNKSGAARKPGRKVAYKYEKEMSFLPSVKGKDRTESNLNDEEDEDDVKSFDDAESTHSAMTAMDFSMLQDQDVSSITVSQSLVRHISYHSPSGSDNSTNASPIKMKRVRKVRRLDTIVEEEDLEDAEKLHQSTMYSQETVFEGDQLIKDEINVSQNTVVESPIKPPPNKKKKIDGILSKRGSGVKDAKVHKPSKQFNSSKEKQDSSDFHEDPFVPPVQPLNQLPPSLQKKIEAQQVLESRRAALRAHLLSHKNNQKGVAVNVMKKRQGQEDSEEDSVEKVALKILKQLESSNEEQNSISLFMSALAMRINELPSMISRRVMLTIDQLVVEAEETAEDIPQGSQGMLDYQKKEKHSVSRPPPKSEPEEPVLVNGFGLDIRQRDIDLLLPQGLLNCQIMNFYLNLLTSSSTDVYVFNTFFMGELLKHGHKELKRWTAKVDIFKYRLLLVPINRGMHWTLACIDIPAKSLMFYNSLGSNLYEDCLEALQNFLTDEHLHRKKEKLDLNQWPVMGDFIEGPQQDNGYDCGVFVLEVARHLCQGTPIDFSQADIEEIRQRISTEILSSGDW